MKILQSQTNSKQIEFNELSEKQEKLERMMLECKNSKLLMKFEDDREKVEDAKDKISDFLANEDTLLQTLENLLKMTKEIFQNPVTLWHKIDPRYRKLFFKVLF